MRRSEALFLLGAIVACGGSDALSTSGGSGGASASSVTSVSSSASSSKASSTNASASVASSGPSAVATTGGGGAGGGPVAMCDPASFWGKSGSMVGDDGSTSMCQYKGQVVLVVNTAEL